ncbi:hypothetical protein Lbir_0232 [Legionella birminghamensis]|uniref:HsdR n=1 Tax=Legionella birminghamensis TaxID=28083 RepID=A0A378IAZ5_9GAMM|nr:hypothetical protein [Legionella birminghamensis]KTC76163.1 hypothetical protein Lbir_0232 [Legionella birminghamensis]STX32213.1 Uncharacterised protein [Legionella birminghamensis]
MKNRKQLQFIIENAIDFLKKSLEDINGDLKFSYINFWTGVELLLKARIISEHWSLIVKGQPNLDKYLSGDFCSINFDEMCDVLEKVISSPIDKAHKNILTNIKNHRNKWIHFCNPLSEKDKALLLSDQMHGLYILNLYLNSRWKFVFYDFNYQIKSAYKQLEEEYGPYKKFVYTYYIHDEIANIIKKDRLNIRLSVCPSCRFFCAIRPRYTENIIFNSSCKLCGYELISLFATCEKCKKPNVFSEEKCICNNCHKKYLWVELLTKINIFKLEDHFDVHCYCGSHSLIEYQNDYFCFECKKKFPQDDLNECIYCHGLGPEEMESGCYHCQNYEPCWEDLYPQK